MIRYIIHSVDGKEQRLALHTFSQENAILEVPGTGEVRVVPANQIRFDPPTEVLIDQEIRSRAMQSPGPTLMPPMH